jgi:hypothetical protein
MISRHLAYGTCGCCGHWYAIRVDGLIRVHCGLRGNMCPGSARPPRGDL